MPRGKKCEDTSHEKGVRKNGKPYCVTCKKASDKITREKKPLSIRNAERKKYYDKVRKEVRAIKESNPCLDCGIRYPWWIMQFDHLPGTEKVGAVGWLITNSNRQAVFDEIEKCEVVCANCHANRTAERAGWVNLYPQNTVT